MNERKIAGNGMTAKARMKERKKEREREREGERGRKRMSGREPHKSCGGANAESGTRGKVDCAWERQ